MYQPGLHIIATISTDKKDLLVDFFGMQNLVNWLIENKSLEKLGEVYHKFPTGGYTSVICLSESHLSMHTWPEYGKVNLDIYLSNFLRNNDGTVDQIFHSLVQYFEGTVSDVQKIRR